MAKDKKKYKEIEIVNRKAAYQYEFIKKYEAGIMLTGTEIKSIRLGNANLRDAYCFIRKGELFIKSLFIAEYKYGNQNNHEERRLRKLLLKKTELKQLDKKVKERGFTIIPYRIYISDRGICKVEIALASGKKTFDKRQTVKDRDQKRELDRARKGEF